MKKNKIIDVYFDFLRELYANSIGFDGRAGDFDDLMLHKQIGLDGRPTIAMDDYYLDRDKFEEIVNKYKKYEMKKLRPYERKMLEHELYLGASPTCNKESWEQRKQIYKQQNNLKEGL